VRRVAVVLAVLVAINVAAASTRAQVDLSANRRFSLSSETRAVLRAVKQPLDITAFINESGGAARDARFLLARFGEVNRHIDYEIVDPDERPSEARRFGITSYATVVLEYDGRRADAPQVSEPDLATAILRLLRARTPTVCVTTGHGEAALDDDGPSGLSKVATLLEQNAYRARTIDLARGGDVPAACEVVWLAGPRVALTPAESDSLRRYEREAGKLLVLASPLSEANLNPLLEPYGITFLGGVVADPDRSASVDPTDVVAEDFPTANPVMDGIPRLQLPVTGGLLTAPPDDLPAGLTVSRLAVSSGAAWVEATPDEGFAPDPGDLPGPVALAAAADDSRIEAGAERRVGGTRPGIVRTRVVVTGSAEWPTNQLLDRLGNRRLLVGALSWLTQEEELLTVATRLPGARPLPWTAERQRQTLFVTVGVVPALVVLAGLASWGWRRCGVRHTSMLLLLAMLVAGCGASSGNPTSATTLPPNVVPERATAWTSITVRSNADGREAEVPDHLRSKAAPLLTGRLLSSPEPPPSYGLDEPAVTITYTGTGRTRTILVGDANFDGHGYYVQRRGDPRVFLVPADQLGPLLALVQTEAPR
jgi:ABC-type uncharacterized transport system involved in gliding motility auxiliary subunit